MDQQQVMDGYGVVEDATLTIERRLPGTVERVWAYLTQSDLRRQWLAAGDMTPEAGSSFELVWRNDDLSAPPGGRPAGFAEEHRMQGQITEIEPPNRLVITWGGTGGVSISLRQQADEVILTLVHRRLPDRATTLMIGAGWHMHLDILAALARGEAPASFWDGWSRLRDEYDRRLPV